MTRIRMNITLEVDLDGVPGAFDHPDWFAFHLRKHWLHTFAQYDSSMVTNTVDVVRGDGLTYEILTPWDMYVKNNDWCQVPLGERFNEED